MYKKLNYIGDTL